MKNLMVTAALACTLLLTACTSDDGLPGLTCNAGGSEIRFVDNQDGTITIQVDGQNPTRMNLNGIDFEIFAAEFCQQFSG